MKKKCLVAIFFALILSFVAVFATACTGSGGKNPETPGPQTEQYEEPTNGLWYTYDEDTDSYLVSAGNAKYEKRIVIPSAYDGKPVTTIPNRAFEDCAVESIVFPENVKSIGEAAFSGCGKLTEITIPASVTSIGRGAFYGCTNLQTVNWNATNCAKAGGYSYPIFSGCTSLTTVNIGEKVETIPSYAFDGCTGLTKVNITDLAAWCNIDFVDYSSNPLYYTHNLYINNVLQREITIPASVTSIGRYAFYNCINLQTVTFAGESELESIGDSAFSGCSNLTSITIPASVTSIGWHAFNECANLQTVTFAGESKLQSIGYGAFSGCSSLTSITIPASVTSIDQYAFENCTNLQTIKFVGESKLKTIGNYAFYGCGLTEITIPASVTSIGEKAFYNCTNLQTVAFADESKLESIGDGAFV